MKEERGSFQRWPWRASRKDDALKKTDIIEIYSNINDQINNLRQTEFTLRALLATWFAAISASIGFVLVNHDKIVVYKPESFVNVNSAVFFVCAAIALVGWWGLLLIWRLDIRIYHRLLDSYFRGALEFEEKYEWLPKCNTYAVSRLYPHAKARQSVLVQVKEFYCSVSTTFLVGCQGFLLYGLAIESSAEWALLVIATSSIIIDVGVWWYLWNGTSSNVLENYILSKTKR